MRIEYRPSAKTVVEQLQLSAIAVIVLAMIIWFAGWPWSPPSGRGLAKRVTDGDLQAALELQSATEEIKRLLPPEQVAELERDRVERLAKADEGLARLRFQRSILSSAARGFHWLAFSAMLAIGVLPLISLPLLRVVIEKSQQGELVIRKCGLWPSTRRWPQGVFTRIVCGVEPERRRWRSLSYNVGWRWIVTLRGEAASSMGHASATAEDLEVSFYVDRQRYEPAPTDVPPESVRAFAEALLRLIKS